MYKLPKLLPLIVGLLGLNVIPAQNSFASSHKEAPEIAETPKVDASDFYMFRSYEDGRDGYVTLIANYLPLQDAYGGPNYFMMDPDAVYDINIDNNGDAKSDITFRFKFKNTLNNFTLNVGPDGQQQAVAVPLINIGTIEANNTSNLNVTESYSVEVLKKQKRKGAKITNAFTNANSFVKPVDNIGNKSIPDYVAYANSHIYNVNIPGCGQPGRMFVGQRADPFVVNLGETFDLVNLNPLGEPDAKPNTLADKNVTSMILEVHTDCLLAQGDTTIAAWTTASLRQKQTLRNKPRFLKSAKQKGDWIQVSRLANPLVNELVIGLKDKDRFNSSSPHKDAYFATYVTNPTLPELLELLFGVTAPNQFPRTDLVSIFLTGVEGLNKTNATAELMRLNTAIAPKAAAAQSNLGVLGGDTSGYPNGRRPGDDVVEFR